MYSLTSRWWMSSRQTLELMKSDLLVLTVLRRTRYPQINRPGRRPGSLVSECTLSSARLVHLDSMYIDGLPLSLTSSQVR